MGVWESAEMAACMDAFAQLIGLVDLTTLFVVLASKAEGRFEFVPPTTALNQSNCLCGEPFPFSPIFSRTTTNAFFE